LPNVELAADTHLGRHGVSDVGVVFPDDSSRVGPIERQQRLERVEHVGVSQVPRRRRAVIHRPVIPFGVGDDAGVLSRVEEALTVFESIVEAFFEHVSQHGDNGMLRALVATDEHRLPVACWASGSRRSTVNTSFARRLSTAAA
jgi:hypothetical protein